MKRYRNIHTAGLKTPLLSSIFTVLVVVYPILNRYAAPIPFLTLSEFLLLLVFCVSLFRSGIVNNKVMWAAIPFVCYLIIHILLDTENLVSGVKADAVGTALRLLFIYFMIAMLSKDLFLASLGEKVLLAVAIGVSIYGLLQVAFSFAGITLSTYLPLLPVMDGINADQLVMERMAYGTRFRCQSILNEPSHLCCFLILPLILCLFPSNRKGKTVRYRAAILFTVVCFVSASSTGILIASSVWILHFVGPVKWSGRRQLTRLFTGLIVATIAAFLFYATGLWDYFVIRTFGGTGDLSGILSGTRFYALDEMFAASNSVYGVFFGTGLAKIAEFLPGFSRVYLNLGLIGLILIFWMLVKLFLSGDTTNRIILSFFSVLNIGTEIILGSFAAYYLPFCLPDTNDEAFKKGSILDVRKRGHR